MKESQVLDILTKAGFRPKKRGENISIRCPLAPYTPLHRGSRDSRPSMGIKVMGGAVLVNCFTCQFKSRQLSWLFKRLNSHNRHWGGAVTACLEMERESLGSGLADLQKRGYGGSTKEELKPFDESIYAPYSRVFHKYWLSRGVSLETGKRWDVGLDRERGRVLVPFRCPKGKLWGAVGGSFTGSKPKYINYWRMKKGLQLMGSQLIKRSKKIVITEGMVDAMLADQALINAGLGDTYGVVSVLGASLTEAQGRILNSIASEVILAFDNDEAGRLGQRSAQKTIGKSLLVRTVTQAQGRKDFGESTQEEIVEVIRKSKLLI